MRKRLLAFFIANVIAMGSVLGAVYTTTQAAKELEYCEQIMLASFAVSDNDMSNVVYYSTDGEQFYEISTAYKDANPEHSDYAGEYGAYIKGDPNKTHTMRDPSIAYDSTRGLFWMMWGISNDGKKGDMTVEQTVVPILGYSKDLVNWTFPTSANSDGYTFDKGVEPPAKDKWENGVWDVVGQEMFIDTNGDMYMLSSCGYYAPNHWIYDSTIGDYRLGYGTEEKLQIFMTKVSSLSIDDNEYNISFVNNVDGSALLMPGTITSSKTEGHVTDRVTIKANPNPGFKFKEWKIYDADINSDDLTSPEAVITLSKLSATVKAEYEKVGNPITYTGKDLEGNVIPNSVNVQGSDVGMQVTNESLNIGTQVNIIAQEVVGYEFVRWEGTGVAINDVSSKNTKVVMLDEEGTVTARFKKITDEAPTLPTLRNVTVKSDDLSMGMVVGDVNKTYVGDTFGLVAIPKDNNYKFKNWEVSSSVTVDNTDNPKAKFTINDAGEAPSIKAVFEEAVAELSKDTSGLEYNGATIEYDKAVQINLPCIAEKPEAGDDHIDPQIFKKDGWYYLSVKENQVTNEIYKIDSLSKVSDPSAWILVSDDVCTGYEGPSLTNFQGNYFMYTDRLAGYPLPEDVDGQIIFDSNGIYVQKASTATTGEFDTYTGWLESNIHKVHTYDKSGNEVTNKHGTVLTLTGEAAEKVRTAIKGVYGNETKTSSTYSPLNWSKIGWYKKESYRFPEIKYKLEYFYYVDDKRAGVKLSADEDYVGAELYDLTTKAWYLFNGQEDGLMLYNVEMTIPTDLIRYNLVGAKNYGTDKKDWRTVRYDHWGRRVSGWDGSFYYNPLNGAKAFGSQTIDGVNYYFDEKTGALVTKTGWITIDGRDYWYENGIRQGYEPNNSNYRGKEIFDPESEAWYWLDNVDNGAKAVSKDVYQESQADNAGTMGKWVRYDEEGHMVKGWDITENGFFYFDEVYGTMYKGVKTIDKVKYTFDENDGTLVSSDAKASWKKEKNVYYWYENGEKQGVKYNEDGSLDVSYRGKEIYDPITDGWYWLDCVQNGAITKAKDVYQESLAGPWGDIEGDDGNRYGKWVRYDEYGRMIKGWQTSDKGEEYYFDEVYGTMAKGYCTIDGKEYYFNPVTGVLEATIATVPKNGWRTAIDGKNYWYENGNRQGYSINENYRGKEIYDPFTKAWYWLDNVQNGAKAVSKDVYQESLAGSWGDKTDDDGNKIGKWVRYDEDGHMIKGWSENENGTYYFDEMYGTMAKGYVTIKGQSYHFDENTGVLISEDDSSAKLDDISDDDFDE